MHACILTKHILPNQLFSFGFWVENYLYHSGLNRDYSLAFLFSSPYPLANHSEHSGCNMLDWSVMGAVPSFSLI